MRNLSTFLLAVFIACMQSTAAQSAARPRILLYTKTAGFRHDSIPTAIRIIASLGNGSLTLPSSTIDPTISTLRWDTINTEDETLFHDPIYLSQFKAIGFLSTTDVDPPGAGTVLDDQGLRNFARYIQQGGNYFGIHSASATLFGAPFYGRLVGAYFDYHPQIQNVTVRSLDRQHPSTSKWPDQGLRIYEEMYNYRSDPRNLPSRANVLVSNATSYQDPGVNPQAFRNGSNGPEPHPLAWWREARLLDTDAATDPSVSGGGGAGIQVSGGSGRSWYTSLGHDNSTWAQDLFRGHVAGGIGWVLQSSTAPLNASAGGSNSSESAGASASPTTSSTAGSSNRAISSTPAHEFGNIAACFASMLLLIGLSAA